MALYYETVPSTKELHSIWSEDMVGIFPIEMKKNTCFHGFFVDAVK